MATIHTSAGAPSSLENLLSPEDWRRLEAHMELAEFAPGEHLLHHGDLRPNLLIIREGVASVQGEDANGQPRELSRIGTGESVGEMALLTGEPASADVVAITRVRAYAASHEKLASLDELRPRVIEALSAILAARLKHANERLLTLSAAKTHVLVCDQAGFDALRGLPAAVADVVGGRILVVLRGEHAAAQRMASERVVVRAIAPEEEGDLSRILHRAAHEYAEILIYRDRASLPLLADDPASIIYATHADASSVPGNVRASARLAIVGSDAKWTQPTLRRLSESYGHPVVAVLPGDGASDNGDAMLRFARTLVGRQIGLALGAGAAKGLAHLGVLRALRDMGVPVDMVTGCSIGSAIAAGVAAGMDLDELSELTKQAAGRAIRPTLPLRSFLSNAGVRDELKRLAEDRRIEDLDLPLAVVAVDLFRRSEVTFTSGLIWPRLLASMAIPGVYPPSPAMGSYLVDGGVLNPVPVRQCRDLGAGIVIGVRLTATRTSPRERLDFKPAKPLAIETIMRTFEIMLNRISEVSHEHADVNIEVCVDGTGGVRDFKRGDEIGALGYRATIEAQPSLAGAMPYLKGAAV